MKYLIELIKFKLMCKRLKLTKVTNTVYKAVNNLNISLEPDGAVLMDLPDGSKHVVKNGRVV